MPGKGKYFQLLAVTLLRAFRGAPDGPIGGLIGADFEAICTALRDSWGVHTGTLVDGLCHPSGGRVRLPGPGDNLLGRRHEVGADLARPLVVHGTRPGAEH